MPDKNSDFLENQKQYRNNNQNSGDYPVNNRVVGKTISPNSRTKQEKSGDGKGLGKRHVIPVTAAFGFTAVCAVLILNAGYVQFIPFATAWAAISLFMGLSRSFGKSSTDERAVFHAIGISGVTLAVIASSLSDSFLVALVSGVFRGMFDGFWLADRQVIRKVNEPERGSK